MPLIAWCAYCSAIPCWATQGQSKWVSPVVTRKRRSQLRSRARLGSIRIPTCANDDYLQSSGLDGQNDHRVYSSSQDAVISSVSSSDGQKWSETGLPTGSPTDYASDYYSLGGLMKDSVLELKWKAEQNGQSRRSGSTDMTLSAGCRPRDRIVPVADPARSFKFTRIAAPTALLGRPEVLEETDSQTRSERDAEDMNRSRQERSGIGILEANDHPDDDDRNSHDRSAFSVVDLAKKNHDQNARTHSFPSENVAPGSSPAVDTVMPYSPASLVHRMYKYMRAQKHRAEFLSLFQGEFDNYEQIAAQRANGILPREGGGHEHIHCSLTVLNDDTLFARYYFNGNPSVVFRSRLYRINAMDKSDRGLLEMRIFRFYEETEQRLKASNYDINSIEWSDDDIYDWLEGCEVFWERYEPPNDSDDVGSRTLNITGGLRYVGYMEGGGCELFSREVNGRIRVMDDLLVTAHDLWVSDRGFDESGHFIYGNRSGEPYKMKRIDPDGPLAWTLSAEATPPENYTP